MKFISIFTLLLATFVSPGWASELRLACKGSSYDFSVDGNPRPPHTLNIYALNGVVSLSDTFFLPIRETLFGIRFTKNLMLRLNLGFYPKKLI